jgi:UDP-N-acetylmuramate dehydrogenase
MVTLAPGECGFSYRMSRFKSGDAARFVVCAVTLRVRPGAPTVRYPELEHQLAGIARPSLAEVREAVLVIRRRKGMVVDAADPDSRSVGSFFMNPVVSLACREEVSRRAGIECPSFPMGSDQVKIPAAWLIERSGFRKGFTDGPVAISSKHPLALVNRGGATTRDVLRLAITIKRHVLDRFDVAIQTEPVFVAFDGDDADVEFLKAAAT